jgi:hypothetical protein
VEILVFEKFEDTIAGCWHLCGSAARSLQHPQSGPIAPPLMR